MIEDILKQMKEDDVIDDTKITKEDWAFLAAHLSEVPVIDTLLKRMMSQSMRNYFKVNVENNDARIAYKVEYNILSKLRKFVEAEKQKKAKERGTR